MTNNPLDFGFFTPYVEAEFVQPFIPKPTTSGSNTAAIDYLRQGVEVLTDAQFFGGVLPQLGTDDHINHQLNIATQGQSDEFLGNVLFRELVKFDPVVFIESQVSSLLMFPVVLDDPAFSDPERLGGFIEPLTVGSRDFLVTATEFELHDIRGELMGGGNEDSFRKTDRIVQFIDLKEPSSKQGIFVDGVDVMGTGSVVPLGGLFPEGEKPIRPFDETTYLTRAFPSGSLADAGADVLHIVETQLSGSDSSDYVPSGFLSAGTGFVYDHSVRGTDSLAFGGLRNS